jgi:hypothetical protein
MCGKGFVLLFSFALALPSGACGSNPSAEQRTSASRSQALFTLSDTPNTGQGSSALAWLTGDVNGDGKTDIIQPWSNGGGLGMVAYTSDGTGYSRTWGTDYIGEGANALAWLTGDGRLK